MSLRTGTQTPASSSGTGRGIFVFIAALPCQVQASATAPCQDPEERFDVRVRPGVALEVGGRRDNAGKFTEPLLIGRVVVRSGSAWCQVPTYAVHGSAWETAA